MNPPPGPARLAGLILAVLVLASGCADGTEDAGAGAPTTAAAPPAGTSGTTVAGARRRGLAGALVRPYELDRKVWFQGFAVRLTTATVEPDERNLQVGAEVENQGERPSQLQAPARIDQGGVTIARGTLRSATAVAAGTRDTAAVDIPRLPADFDPARAVLVLGGDDRRQVRVPLVGPGPAVTGEPRQERPPGPLRAGALTVDFDHLWVRSDSPLDHAQAARDRAYVILTGFARFDGLMTNVQSENFALTPPVGPPEGPSYLNLLPQGSQPEPIYAVFEMAAPLGGPYQLRVQGNYTIDELGLATLGASGETRLTLGVYPPPA